MSMSFWLRLIVPRAEQLAQRVRWLRTDVRAKLIPVSAAAASNHPGRHSAARRPSQRCNAALQA